MVIEMLRHTPAWVFVLFIGLVLMGFRQTFAQRASKTRLMVLPGVMAILSLTGVCSVFGAHAAGIAGWASGVGAAALASGLLLEPNDVGYSAVDRRYTLPGSWWPMLLMLAIFFIKYAVAVALAREPALVNATSFATGASLAYGLSSGVFLARAVNALRAPVEPRGATCITANLAG